MTYDEVKALVLSFPQAEEGTSYGMPSFKIAGKFFTRLRSEDDSLVLLNVTTDEREMLMQAEPQTFHITDHYRGYPSVLARIGPLDPGTLRNFLERRWRAVAPKKLVKAYDAEQSA
ncbi:MAG TPA: MmcQ/YjbR family DNA-binding protein [Caulobacteraceae bacterium]|jgi:hypothetical protein